MTDELMWVCSCNAESDAHEDWCAYVLGPRLDAAGKNEVWLTEMQAATEQRAVRLEILCGELIAELGDDPARRLVPIVGRALDIQVKLEAAEAENARLQEWMESQRRGVIGFAGEWLPSGPTLWEEYAAPNAAPVVTVLPRTITAGADSLVTERDFNPEPVDATFSQVLGGRS